MDYKNAIKKLRRKLALTQTELGTILGVSYKSVNRWENGRYEPTTSIKKKLMVLFKENDIEVEM